VWARNTHIKQRSEGFLSSAKKIILFYKKGVFIRKGNLYLCGAVEEKGFSLRIISPLKGGYDFAVYLFRPKGQWWEILTSNKIVFR